MEGEFKIIVLNCHDSATGMVAAFPVRRKADIHYMAREVASLLEGLVLVSSSYTVTMSPRCFSCFHWYSVH